MINFTAVMRYSGFCGGGDQTRNVNYCMAPGNNSLSQPIRDQEWD